MKMSKVSKVIIYILLGLMALYFLSPFVYMLFTAFKTETEAIAYPPKLFPAKWLWQNFTRRVERTALRNIFVEFNSRNCRNHGGTGDLLLAGGIRIRTV